MKAGVAAAWVALWTSASAIAQQPQAVEDDLRCVAVLSALASTLQGEQQMQVAAGVMYFVGHLEGIAPGIDLKAGLGRVASGLKQEDMASEGQRCGGILAEKGTALQQIGKELSGQGD